MKELIDGFEQRIEAIEIAHDLVLRSRQGDLA